MNEMGKIVFVRWYGSVLQGEVVENDRDDQLAGMVAVRIPIQGVHATALFFPQHVYQSEDEAAVNGNSPIISSNPQKVATEQREISRTVPEEVKSYIADVYINDAIQRFKAANWDETHNHLRIEALDEFYRLWLKTHDRRNSQSVTSEEVTLPSHKTEPEGHAASDEITVRPQRDYGSQPTTRNVVKITLPSHKSVGRMRCWRCEHLDYDHISDRQEVVTDGEHFCGLHGRARVDPDGPQQNLNRKSGCGFTPRKQTVQLDLFS